MTVLDGKVNVKSSSMCIFVDLGVGQEERVMSYEWKQEMEEHKVPKQMEGLKALAQMDKDQEQLGDANGQWIGILTSLE